MYGIPLWILIALVGLTVLAVLFVWLYWKKAPDAHGGLRWISRDSRNAYVDCAKTLITASGISVTLLASSGGTLTRLPIVEFSVKIAVTSLILCVVFSMAVMLALVRFHELAISRCTEQEFVACRCANAQNPEGALKNSELGWILVLAFFALVTFLWGLVFLGIIAWHF